jgi:Zn-dependent peptidase ImmA (M78 family)
MTKKVPYLYEEQIERDASALLAEFSAARGVVIAPPIPIEDVIEKHLKLRIEFDDTHCMFGVPRSGPGLDPDILGAIYFDERRIVIDESLDPDENPSREGRYRYTLAHEGGGHWRLHRHLFAHGSVRPALFEMQPIPSVICRSSRAKEPIEWQADFYASCLLMPRKLVLAAWDEMFPDRKQRVIQPRTPCEHRYVEIIRLKGLIAGNEFPESDDLVLERFAKPFAKKFLVSPVAMRIRLEQIGLLHRVVPGRRLLDELGQLAAGTYGQK